ncbi:ABC transporter ATP-binding protein [Actinomarinicola tropica]|uniref:ATP-binding cassette domain-containing protein n=1 Tax=Actinomarinicola tropica TaxID=2789776 RepID=A0A5Q2RQ57_9ACTN|nr:ABC transporter ATP-binding protein [Actinomarinicola tropica]QGG96030.1 ATP-binding cassette domain-containing protein [Actinomarinicola tropica]
MAITRAASALRAVDLRCGYGDVDVVTGACVDVRPGEVTALVGANGSGKSTLLRSMARLHTPTSGDVLLDGDTPALALSLREFARRVTLLTQSRPSPAGIPVRDVVAYGRHPHRHRWRGTDPDGAEAIAWAMEVTGVTPMADRGIDELSGGERQRVWLATCLCQRTSVLLLDEPTTFLDLRYQVEILELVRDLADVHGVAVGIVLHDLQQACDVADRVVLLADRAVLAAGPPEDVMTAELLSAAFGIRIDVHPDAETGVRRIHPVGRHTHRARQLA